MSMQALVDAMSAQWARERAATQMTLGALIERVEKFAPGQLIIGLDDAHSYRGYYSDLAFEVGEKRTAADVLAMLKECMGQEFQGYKGGEFRMHSESPCWIANYGCCGKKLLSIDDDGAAKLGSDE